MPRNKSGDQPAFTKVIGKDISFCGGSADERSHDIATEVPVNVIYGSVPFAVMMTTPVDLEDFAYGFTFTEGIVDKADDIRDVSIEETQKGIKLSITLRAENMQRHLGRARNLAGRTGCGVCGIADLAEMPSLATRYARTVEFAPTSISKALGQMDELQTLNKRTHAVHAAAYCDATGTIIALREDVGRHNALDKLAGSILRDAIEARDGFLLITSRASYEMVEKATRLGVSLLVAISAPTSLAIERANALGMTLVGIARADGAVAFSGPASLLKGDLG